MRVGVFNNSRNSRGFSPPPLRTPSSCLFFSRLLCNLLEAAGGGFSLLPSTTLPPQKCSGDRVILKVKRIKINFSLGNKSILAGPCKSEVGLYPYIPESRTASIGVQECAFSLGCQNQGIRSTLTPECSPRVGPCADSSVIISFLLEVTDEMLTFFPLGKLRHSHCGSLFTDMYMLNCGVVT